MDSVIAGVSESPDAMHRFDDLLEGPARLRELFTHGYGL